MPAPPVIEFDRDGTVIQSWGGPGEGYEWPVPEHGIRIDFKGNVRSGGNGAQWDGMGGKSTMNLPELDLLSCARQRWRR